jgi:MFS family permease
MTPITVRFRETFESLRSRNFRLFFVGQLISATGTWVQQVAAAWLVLRLTSSGVALGVDTGLTFLPMLLFGFWGGSLADLRDRRRLLITTNALLGVLALVLWALVDTGAVELWMVFGLSFLSGTVSAIDTPTRQSFYAEMVEEGHLANAVSLNSAVMTGSRIIGPALAAGLIAGVGLAWCFLLNAISYLAAIAALLAMRPEELRAAPTARRESLRQTLAYVRADATLWIPIVVMASLFTLSFNFSVTMPLLAERTFGGGVGTYGGLLSLYGLGSFLGALAMARVRDPNPRRLAWGAVAFGVGQGLLAVSPTLAVAHVVVVAFGVVSMAFMITGNTGLQLAARPDMRGRVMAIYAIVFLGGTPVGAPITGALAEHFGPREAVAFGAVAAIVTGLVALGRLGLRGPVVRSSVDAYGRAAPTK